MPSKLTRVVPPLNRKWIDVLPMPYRMDYPVIAVVLPADWSIHEGTTKDEKYQVLAALSGDKENCLGLQIVDADVPKYMDQRDAFYENGTKMADPEYIGPLSQIPNDLLLDENTQVIVFLRDEMWRAPLNLKKVWRPVPQENKC